MLSAILDLRNICIIFYYPFWYCEVMSDLGIKDIEPSC